VRGYRFLQVCIYKLQYKNTMYLWQLYLPLNRTFSFGVLLTLGKPSEFRVLLIENHSQATGRRRRLTNVVCPGRRPRNDAPESPHYMLIFEYL
jgi:hypothetical protein